MDPRTPYIPDIDIGKGYWKKSRELTENEPYWEYQKIFSSDIHLFDFFKKRNPTVMNLLDTITNIDKDLYLIGGAAVAIRSGRNPLGSGSDSWDGDLDFFLLAPDLTYIEWNQRTQNIYNKIKELFPLADITLGSTSINIYNGKDQNDISFKIQIMTSAHKKTLKDIFAGVDICLCQTAIKRVGDDYLLIRTEAADLDHCYRMITPLHTHNHISNRLHKYEKRGFHCSRPLFGLKKRNLWEEWYDNC
jgi:hypothetical protein